MESQSNLFLIAFLILSFILWQMWQIDHAVEIRQTKNIQKKSDTLMLNNDMYPKVHMNKTNDKSKIITVKTDVLLLKINMYGGKIEQADLLTYPKTLGSNTPFQLLQTTPSYIYQADSGLIINDNLDHFNQKSQPLYTSSKDYFEMSNGENQLNVPLTWTDENGVVYTKTFMLHKGNFAITVKYHINNTSKKDLKVKMFGQLNQSIESPQDSQNKDRKSFALHSFRGVAYSANHLKYEKYKFNNIAKNHNLNITASNCWIAMIQQYFATAWVPRKEGDNNIYTNNLGDGLVAVGYQSNPINVLAGTEKQISAILWLGPKIQDQMVKIAPYLDLTVDYGWLWFISQTLLKLLKLLNYFIGNWGFSIIFITFIVRGIMYPLTKAQYHSMAKMRMLQPKIQTIRDQFGNDKNKLGQAMMQLYKTEKVNPLGGCLPVIIQMPIFLALYYMLSASVELRHAPFILWMHDLSSQDPYYILPVIMGITMFLIQKMSPNTVTDPTQQKIMNYMPIIFTVFFLWFPSGLVLYYIVSNIFTLLQQHLIFRSLEKSGLHT